MNKQSMIESRRNLYFNESAKTDDNINAIQQTQINKASEFAKMIYSMQKSLPITSLK